MHTKFMPFMKELLSLFNSVGSMATYDSDNDHMLGVTIHGQNAEVELKALDMTDCLLIAVNGMVMTADPIHVHNRVLEIWREETAE